MPQAIAFVAAGAGGVAGATALGYGIGSVIAYQAISLAVLTVVNRKLADRNKPSGKGDQSRDLTVRATDAYETFVYGRAMVGGVTVYNNAITAPMSLGDNASPNNNMVHVVKWACHPVNCLQLFRLDDRALDPSVDSIQWNPVTYVGSGLVQTGVFRGYGPNGPPTPTTAPACTRLRWYDGRQTSADALLDFFAADWKPTAVGRDRTYGILEIRQVQDDGITDQVYQRGYPTNIQAYVHGRSVYDSRYDALNADPEFARVDSYWTTAQTSGSAAYGYFDEWSEARGIGGPRNVGAQVIDNDHDAEEFFHEPVRVDPSSHYSIFMTARRSAGGRPVYWGVSFWTDNGDNISGIGGLGWPSIGAYWYALANTQIPTEWTDYVYRIGSGDFAMPASAYYARVGFWGVSSHASFPQDSTTIQVRRMGVYMGSGSRQLVGVSSTWAYSQNPPYCAADYLRNEQFGFGKESRLPVNASRYAMNDDPCFRRRDSLAVSTYWRSAVNSGDAGSVLSPFGSLTSVVGGPVGARTLVMVASAGSIASPANYHSELMPIDPTGHYVFSAYARQDGARSALMGLWYLDANGLFIGTGENFGLVQVPSVWSNYTFAIGSGTGNAIPSSVRNAVVTFSAPRSGTGGSGASDMYWQEVQLQVGTQIRRFVEPWEQIDWKSVSSAASYCDRVVSTPSGDQVRFQCNGQGDTGRSYRENLKSILSAGNLRATYGQSGWLIFGGWQEPDVTLNEADLRGPLEVRGAAETRDRYNSVRGMFYDRHQDGKQVPSATVTAAEYRARDNSMQLFEDVDLQFTDDWFGAQRVQFGLLEQGDNQMIARAPVGYAGLGLQSGRHVSLRVRPMSWTPKTFLMTELTYDIRRGVMSVLREDFEASYVDPTSAEYVPRSGGGVTSYAPHVPQVSSVTATYLGRDGARLRWVNPSNRAFEWVDVYRDQAAIGVTSFFHASLIKSVRADEYADPAPMGAAGTQAAYWFVTRDFAGNVSSVYPTPTSGVVIAPGTVPQVSSVTAASQPDAVRLRWVNPSSSPYFEWVDVYRRTATNAYSGSSLVRSTRGDEHLDQFGIGDNFRTYYYWLVTRDHLGNQSSVYPGLTSSFSSTPVVPVAKDPEYVFFEEFNYQSLEQMGAAWEAVTVPYSAGITFPSSGLRGGQALRASSTQAWFVSRTRIPYDAEALYRMSARTRMTTSHAQRAQYIGFVGYRADGVSPIDISSNAGSTNAHYFTAVGVQPSSLDLWSDRVGHVYGRMPWPASGSVSANVSQDPKQSARMHDLVRYVSPVFLLGYDTGAGAQEVDYISVEKVRPTGMVYDGNTLNGSNWISGGNGVFGSAVWDLLAGQRPDYRDTSVGGRFGVVGLPISNNSLFASVERFRPDFHAAALANNSASLFWSAEVYANSGGDAFVAATYLVYTKEGSACYFGQGTTFTIGSRDAWQTAKSFHRFFPVDVNPTSYPPPWFVSVGATALTSTTSVFVSRIRVDVG